MAKQRVGIEVFLEDGELKSGLANADKEVKTWAQGVSSSIGKIASVGQNLFFTINGFSQAFKLLNEVMSKPIDTASDYDEVFSKFSVVFGEYTDNVRQWAKDVGNAETGFGRSEMALLSMLSTMQDTFVPMGFARKEASELSKSLVALAVDVASFNNKMDEDVIADFQSAIVGNHETVRKYGIVITEATLKAEALASGITDNVKAMTNEEKIRARLNIITKGTTDAQGDALRTAQGDANTRKRLNALMEDTYKILGQKMLPAHTAWLEIQIGLVKSFQDFIRIPVSEKMREEQISLNSLVNRVTSLNIKNERRAELIKEIQRDYPDFLKNIDAEKVSNQELADSLKSYNDQVLLKIRMQVLEEDRNKVLSKQGIAIDQVVRKEIALSTAIETALANNKEELEALGFTIDRTKSLTDQAKDLKNVYGSLLRNHPFSPKLSKEVQALDVGTLRLVNAQKKRVEVEKEINTELAIFEETKKRIKAGLIDDDGVHSNKTPPGKTKKAQDHKEYLIKKKNYDLEYFLWEEKTEEERLENIKKLKEQEAKFKDKVRADEAKKDADARKKIEDDQIAHMELMIGLAVDMGDALVRGFEAEGLKGALKESLLLLLSFYEKKMLMEQFEAGAKAIGGDPRAAIESLFIAAGFEAVKASVRNFAEGGIVKARPGGIIGRIGEAGHDEAVIPLSGSNAPFGDLLLAIQSLERTVKEAPPQLINSTVKGGDLELILDYQKRKRV